MKKERLTEIEAISDDQIDTSDIPEVDERFFTTAELKGWPGAELRSAFNEYFQINIPDGTGGQVLGDMADVLSARMGMTISTTSNAFRFAKAFDLYFNTNIANVKPVSGMWTAVQVLRAGPGAMVDLPW